MKITVVVDSISRINGGIFEAERRLQQMMALLADTSVKVFGMEDEFSGEDLPKWHPIRPQVFRTIGPSAFGYARGLTKSISESDVDVIYSAGLWKYPSMVSLAWSKQTRKPLLVAPHGMMDPWALNLSRWKKRLAGMLYQNAHLQHAACIRALCSAEAQAIRDYGLKNPICIIPNGIDLPKASDGQRREIVEPLRKLKSRGRKILLYLGRIHPKKGLGNLLKAWKMALDLHPLLANEWALAIAGWDQGDHELELQTLAAELQLDSSVVFLGPQFAEAKAVCYRNCDAFILPSFSEGLPMSVLEAWSYGKLVLMTPECNLPDGFRVGAAIKVDPQTQSIVQGLMQLFEMSDCERQGIGEQGLTLVIEQFSWPRIVRQMRAVYDWVLGSGPQPECVQLF